MGSKGMEHFRDATIEDITRDPHRFGAPTFEEFLKSEKYGKHLTEDAKLGILDNGPKQIRGNVRKTFWVVGGVKCKTPEEAQRIAKEKNIDLRFFLPELKDVGNSKIDIYLNFNTEKQQRGSLIKFPGGG